MKLFFEHSCWYLVKKHKTLKSVIDEWERKPRRIMANPRYPPSS